MDIKDLMIGDWVQVHQFYIDEETDEKVFYYEKPIYMQVGEVYNDLIATIVPWTDPKDESTYDEALLEEIEPIILTPEILEKNGWYFGLTSNEEDLKSVSPAHFVSHWAYDEGGGGISLFFPNESDGGCLRICDQNFNRSLEFVYCDTIYVHELQNALRLCGMNKLANNFKV